MNGKREYIDIMRAAADDAMEVICGERERYWYEKLDDPVERARWEALDSELRSMVRGK